MDYGFTSASSPPHLASGQIHGTGDAYFTNKIVEYGNNSEIFIAYKNTIEVWDWFPSPLDNTLDTPKLSQAGGTLFLTACKTIDSVSSNNHNHSNKDMHIVSFKPLNCYRDTNYYVVVVCLKLRNDYYFQLHSLGQIPINKDNLIQQSLVLPPSSFGSYPYTIKNTDKFYIISTDEGCLTIFNKTNRSNPLSNMTLEAKVFDGKPLFDLSGRWFVYVPNNTQEIVQNLKKLNYKKKQLNKTLKKKLKDQQRRGSRNSGEFYDEDNDETTPEIDDDDVELDVTPLKLPTSGPLLNRLIKSLSSTAIDGAFKLSEIGTNKVKTYFSNQKLQTEANSNIIDNVSQENMKNIKNSLVNFINANNNAKKNMNSSQFVVLIDLLTEQPMAIFSPPGSISNISLSPYDAHLATCSARGDNIYIWDLARIPKEISLVAKHNRGRTPSSIDQVLWNTGSSAIGIITRATGSLHWFNNYTDNNKANNDWVLSGLKSSKIFLGPRAAEINGISSSVRSSIADVKNVSNSESDNSITKYNFKKRPLSHNLTKTCILSLNAYSGTLLIISPANGSINWKYELPIKPIPDSLRPDYLVPKLAEIKTHNNLTNYGSDCVKIKDYSQIDPLSEIELETCDPFTPLYMNRRFQFGIYNFDKSAKRKSSFTTNDDLFMTTEVLDSAGMFDHSNLNNFEQQQTENDPDLVKANYNIFGGGFTVNVFHFGRGTGLPVFHSDDADSLALEDSSESLLLHENGNAALNSNGKSNVAANGTKKSNDYANGSVNINSAKIDGEKNKLAEYYGIKSLRNAMESLLIDTNSEDLLS